MVTTRELIEITHEGPLLTADALTGIFKRLDDLIEVVGPVDKQGILHLDRQQRHAVIEFKEWLADAYGPIE